MFNQKSEPINDKEIIKCLDCQNKDICKYTEDMKDLYEYLSNIPKREPLTVKVECAYFKSNYTNYTIKNSIDNSIKNSIDNGRYL